MYIVHYCPILSIVHRAVHICMLSPPAQAQAEAQAQAQAEAEDQ